MVRSYVRQLLLMLPACGLDSSTDVEPWCVWFSLAERFITICLNRYVAELRLVNVQRLLLSFFGMSLSILISAFKMNHDLVWTVSSSSSVEDTAVLPENTRKTKGYRDRCHRVCM